MMLIIQQKATEKNTYWRDEKKNLFIMLLEDFQNTFKYLHCGLAAAWYKFRVANFDLMR